jgi:hypothetical protein
VNSHGAVVAVLALCATGACVKVPAFEPQDARGDGTGNPDDAGIDAGGETPAVSIVEMAGDVLVTTSGYTMRFGSGGSLFPYQLIPAGNHFMGGSPRCDDEDGMGVAIYPVQRVNAVDFPGMGTPTRTLPLDGPWVGQVRIGWSTSFSCGSGSGSVTGTSIFSFFPNGRLTRFDRVVNGAERNASDCTACTGGLGSSFYMTSYTTLIVDPGAFLSDGNEATLDMHGEQVTNPGQTACVNQRQQSIAFSWVDSQARLRVVNTSPRSIAFVKDMFSGATLPAETRVTTTQMGISATESCGTLEQRIQPFSDSDHAIRINDTAVGAALTDGIFGGYPRPDGYPVNFPVTITPGQTISPRMPAGFAVWLYSTSIPATLTLTHSAGHTGSWYRMQRVGQDQLVVWFEVALEQGETITISGS